MFTWKFECLMLFQIYLSIQKGSFHSVESRREKCENNVISCLCEAVISSIISRVLRAAQYRLPGPAIMQSRSEPSLSTESLIIMH